MIIEIKDAIDAEYKLPDCPFKKKKAIAKRDALAVEIVKIIENERSRTNSTNVQ